jgi:hypothetical protein
VLAVVVVVTVEVVEVVVVAQGIDVITLNVTQY